jgi:hypothetical protein
MVSIAFSSYLTYPHALLDRSLCRSSTLSLISSAVAAAGVGAVWAREEVIVGGASGRGMPQGIPPTDCGYNV